MKKLLSFILIVVLAAGCISGCGSAQNGSEPTSSVSSQAAEPPSQSAAPVRSEEGEPATEFDFETESNVEAAAVRGILTAKSAGGEVLWRYETAECGVSELDTVQDIGPTSYGYLLIENGDVVCVETAGEKAGSEKWRCTFGGASACFDFDEDERLYISGYYGPELCIIDSRGKMVSSFEPFCEECFWPYELKATDEKTVEITYYSNEETVTVNPYNGAPRLADEAALKKFLAGRWEYIVPGEEFADMTLAISEDGSFTAVRGITGGGGEKASYSGTWSLERLYNDDTMTPDLLCLSLSETDDGFFGSIGSLGDFRIEDIALCDGRYMMKLTQANNGEAVFSEYYMTYSPLLIKDQGELTAPTVQFIRKGVGFDARCWKVDTDGVGDRVIWLGTGSPFYLNGGQIDTAAPYGAREDADFRFGVSQNDECGYMAEIETDEEGKIAVYNWKVYDDGEYYGGEDIYG